MKSLFDWEEFTRYLVVQNFISHWDGYPQRPKNYWIYHNPFDAKWHYIPWDLDGCFRENKGFLNKMGTDASIFYYFDKYEPYELQENESKERPLVWRMMDHDFFRDAYIREYFNALDTYLAEDRIVEVVDSMATVIQTYASSADYNEYRNSVSETKRFLTAKTENVIDELSDYNYLLSSNLVPEIPEIRLYPQPAHDYTYLRLSKQTNGQLIIDISDLSGRKVLSHCNEFRTAGNYNERIDLNRLSEGGYIVNVIADNQKMSRKLFIVR